MVGRKFRFKNLIFQGRKSEWILRFINQKRIDDGLLQALSVSTTNVFTGRLERNALWGKLSARPDKHFTVFEKFMLRVLDIDPTGGIDFLSYIGFLPEYLRTLIDLGFEDAQMHRSEIIEFLEV